MRFSVKVNDEPRFVAGLDSVGFVGVHFIAYPGRSKLTRVNGRAHKDVGPHETEWLDWAEVELHEGDEVVVTCTQTEAPTEPIKRSLSRNDKRICIHDREVAARVAALVTRHNAELESVIAEVAASASEEDLRSFKGAVGYVLYETFERILQPIFHRHPDLGPESRSSGGGDKDSQ
jgi:hypothetical protein